MILDLNLQLFGSKLTMESGDRSKCDPETLCFLAYHVIG